MVYSQFRQVEGLGILGLVLEKQGFVQIKIKKNQGKWEFDLSDEDMQKPKYMIFTNDDESPILLNIFNSNMDLLPTEIRDKLQQYFDIDIGNKYGDIIKTIMITQSGAEGISLKHVRYVHVMEPYWNNVRIDQVIGRAVRANSHVELLESERDVQVYVYYSKMTKSQIEQSFTLKNKDKGLTTDENIYNIAMRKKKVIDTILDLVKQASIDCVLHGHTHKGLDCFRFPSNIDQNKITYTLDITEDVTDDQYNHYIETKNFKGDVFITKKGNFLVNKATNDVYDYDIYLDTKRYVKIGVFKRSDNGKIIIEQA